MICLCNNSSVFRLGSRIDLGAKTDYIVCMHCFSSPEPKAHR